MENTVKSNSNNTASSDLIKSKWFTWLKRICYVIVAIYFLIWALSPLVANYVIGNLLEENYGLSISENSSIRYNPFTSHLTVVQLGIESHSKQVNSRSGTNELFSLTRLELEIRLHRLMFGELYISEFDISGVNLLVEEQQQGLIVAGIDLSKLENKPQPTAGSTNAESLTDLTEVNPSNELTVKMPLANFSNIKTVFIAASGKHSFTINQWQIENLILNSDQQNLSSQIEVLVNNAPLAMEFDSNLLAGMGELNISLDLKDFQLESIQGEVQPSLSAIKGLLGVQSTQKIKMENHQLTFESPTTSIQLSGLELTNEQLELTAKTHSLKFSDLSFAINLDGSAEILRQPLVVASLDLLMEDIVAVIGQDRIESQSQSVSLKALNIDSNSSVDGSPIEYISKLESLVYQPKSIQFENQEQRLTSEDFVVTINDLTHQASALTIQQVLVERLDGIFKIKQKSGLNNKKDIAQNAKQNLTDEKADSHLADPKAVAEHSTKAEQQQVTDSDNPLDSSDSQVVKIDNIRLVDSQELRFIDESISPNYSQSLTIDVAEIKSIDSALANQQSPFTLIGQSGQYTKIDLSGYVKPFTEQVNLNLKGTLTEFSLPPANSYIQNLLGFEIESGELDTNVEIEIVDSQIKGNTGLKIRGLALAKAENYNQDVLQEQTAMPLNMALGMLKDSDDNLELDIPMLGDLDSPTFGVASFVSLVTKKAIQSAAKSYLIKTFLPYSDVISMTISAGEFILKTRFEDLIYQPRQLQISEAQKEYIDQFVALMKDKESTQVKVCGIATAADLVEAPANPGSATEINDETKNKLRAVALERMNLFKQAAVEKGVESSRLLLCAPKIDLSKESKPRLVLSV